MRELKLYFVAFCLLGIASAAAAGPPNVMDARTDPSIAQTGQNVTFWALTDGPAALVVIQFPDLTANGGMRMLPDSSRTRWSLSMAPNLPMSLKFLVTAYTQEGRGGASRGGILEIQGAVVRRVQAIDWNAVGGFFVGLGQAAGNTIDSIGSAIVRVFSPPPPVSLPPPPLHIDLPQTPANFQPLANVTPLTQVTPLTEVQLLRDQDTLSGGNLLIGNTGAALVGNSGGAFTMPIGNNLKQDQGRTTLSGNTSPESRISYMFQWALGRNPRPDEMESWKRKSELLNEAGFAEIFRNENSRAIRNSMAAAAFMKSIGRSPSTEEVGFLGEGVRASGRIHQQLVSYLPMVRDSYLAVFSREPRPQEYGYWVSVPLNDSRAQSKDALVANHRGWLFSADQGAVGERQAMARAAYKNGSRREATAEEVAQIAQAMPSSGRAYAQLVSYLPILRDSYLQAFNREPRPQELGYWVSVPVNDARAQSYETLMANHQNYLLSPDAGAASERRAMVASAFQSIFHRPPTEQEMEKWQVDVAKGWRYGQLLQEVYKLVPNKNPGGRGRDGKSVGTSG